MYFHRQNEVVLLNLDDEFIVKLSCLLEGCMHICAIQITRIKNFIAINRSTLVKLMRMLFRFVVSACLFGDNFLFL